MANAPKAAQIDDDDDLAAPEIWKVFDDNARFGPRIHEVLDSGRIIQYTFQPGAATEMPANHAGKFLIDEAFRVIDSTGRHVTSVAKQDIAERLEDGEIKLGDDEVIATLDELSREALLKRAQLRVGGEKFKKNAKTEDLIEFLLERADPSAPNSLGGSKRKGDQAKADKAGVGADMASEEEVAAIFDNET